MKHDLEKPAIELAPEEATPGPRTGQAHHNLTQTKIEKKESRRTRLQKENLERESENL